MISMQWFRQAGLLWGVGEVAEEKESVVVEGDD